MNLTKQHLAFVLAIAFSSVVITGILMYIRNQDASISQGCTMEALICPDGSAVGRSGPNCEFSPCPTTSDPFPSSPDLDFPDGDGDQTVFCTEDAKICPDGSAVGRSGPDCEFEACP